MTEGPATDAPRVRHRTVDERSDGQRLDNFLIREMHGVPKTRLYRALRKGEIRVNKGRARADYRLVTGDVVRLPPLHQATRKEAAVVPYYWSERLADRIIRRDDRLLVVNKPSGLAVHGGSGLDFGLIECLRQIYPEDRHLELVHRLDRDTSGLILVSRQPAALRELHGLLRGTGVTKDYLALAVGHWPRHLTLIEAPLEKNTLQSGERMVRVAKGGKPSQTAFSVVRYVGNATLLRASPITGRTHQIRIHARHAGFPLLGDDKYQNEDSAALTRALGLQRLFLHAERLRFRLGDEVYDLNAALDDELADLLDRTPQQ